MIPAALFLYSTYLFYRLKKEKKKRLTHTNQQNASEIEAQNLAHKNNLERIQEEQRLAKIQSQKLKTEELRAKKEWELAEAHRLEMQKAADEAKKQKAQAEFILERRREEIAKKQDERKLAEIEKHKEVAQEKARLAELERQNTAKKYPYEFYLEMFQEKLKKMAAEDYTDEIREKYFRIHIQMNETLKKIGLMEIGNLTEIRNEIDFANSSTRLFEYYNELIRQTKADPQYQDDEHIEEKEAKIAHLKEARDAQMQAILSKIGS